MSKRKLSSIINKKKKTVQKLKLPIEFETEIDNNIMSSSGTSSSPKLDTLQQICDYFYVFVAGVDSLVLLQDIKNLDREVLRSVCSLCIALIATKINNVQRVKHLFDPRVKSFIDDKFNYPSGTYVSKMRYLGHAAIQSDHFKDSDFVKVITRRMGTEDIRRFDPANSDYGEDKKKYMSKLRDKINRDVNFFRLIDHINNVMMRNNDKLDTVQQIFDYYYVFVAGVDSLVLLRDIKNLDRDVLFRVCSLCIVLIATKNNKLQRVWHRCDPRLKSFIDDKFKSPSGIINVSKMQYLGHAALQSDHFKETNVVKMITRRMGTKDIRRFDPANSNYGEDKKKYMSKLRDKINRDVNFFRLIDRISKG